MSAPCDLDTKSGRSKWPTKKENRRKFHILQNLFFLERASPEVRNYGTLMKAEDTV